MSSQTAPAVIPNFDDDSHSGRNTAMHLPVGDARLPAALAPIPGIQAMATKMMKQQIHDLGVPEVPDFLGQIVAAGGHLWAGRMSADMMHVDESDF